jgi:hypothetical protein
MELALAHAAGSLLALVDILVRRFRLRPFHPAEEATRRPPRCPATLTPQ